MSSESPVVLVVDDNRAIANTYTAFLSDEYTVRTAYDGKEALAELDPSVDVVLLDRRMPEVSGDAVLEEIESRQLDCRVVMLTAVDPDFDIIDMGFDEYLVKPIEREELNEVVREMLERATYDDDFRRFLALVSKKATLEAEKSSAELEASDEYARIRDRIDERREQVGIDLSELENDFAAVSGSVRLSDNGGGDQDIPDIPGADDGES
ncbi:response regulator [Halorientalis marina]|jgi:DNA-binding response OmpR family regulator|uniref:response regulator n=1 Tax=Halorientalis marina TaxID=2931976 RepID=UPI001FF697B3|nr:response regulator [Halorientalis marina]